MSLTRELAELARPHPLGQRHGAGVALPGVIEERVGGGGGHGRGNLAGVPRPLAPLRGSVLAIVALSATLAAGCDEKLQNFLKNASARQQARDTKKAEEAILKARGLGPADPVAPEIARAIQVVRTSDYDFLIRKGTPSKRRRKGENPPKRSNGFDFAAMLESKSAWLGRDVNELPQWLDEIGSSTFFSGDEYIVRLPDGREMSFRTWLLEELKYLTPELEEPANP